MVILYFLQNTLNKECEQTTLKLIHLKKNCPFSDHFHNEQLQNNTSVQLEIISQVVRDLPLSCTDCVCYECWKALGKRILTSLWWKLYHIRLVDRPVPLANISVNRILLVIRSCLFPKQQYGEVLLLEL